MSIISYVPQFPYSKYQTGFYYYLGSIVNLSEGPEVHSSISRPQVKFGKSSAFSERVTSITVKNSRASSKRRNSSDHLPLIIFCNRFLFMISFSRTVSPNLTRYISSGSTLRGLHKLRAAFSTSIVARQRSRACWPMLRSTSLLTGVSVKRGKRTG